LRHGEIGPRQIWHAARQRAELEGGAMAAGVAQFLRELGWREFAYQLLHFYPHTPEAPLRSDYAGPIPYAPP